MIYYRHFVDYFSNIPFISRPKQAQCLSINLNRFFMLYLCAISTVRPFNFEQHSHSNHSESSRSWRLIAAHIEICTTFGYLIRQGDAREYDSWVFYHIPRRMQIIIEFYTTLTYVIYGLLHSLAPDDTERFHGTKLQLMPCVNNNANSKYK